MTLDERLDNWGRAQRLGGRSSRPIGSAEGRYRAKAPEANIDLMLIDQMDAEFVERAWRRLMSFDKEVLRLYYIWGAPPHIMCRRLRIRSRPTSVLDLAVAHAKREIGRSLKLLAETPDTVRSRLLATGDIEHHGCREAGIVNSGAASYTPTRTE